MFEDETLLVQQEREQKKSFSSSDTENRNYRGNPPIGGPRSSGDGNTSRTDIWGSVL